MPDSRLYKGGGLLFAQPWASYLTVVVIGSFIPWELYSLLDQVTPLRLTTLGINGVIVWYLLAREFHVRHVKKNGCGGKTATGEGNESKIR